MTCTTYGYFGSPRRFVSRCETYPGLTVTAEAAGSSPVVPAIFSNSCKTLSPSQLHNGCTTVRPETAPFTAFLTSGSTSAGLTWCLSARSNRKFGDKYSARRPARGHQRFQFRRPESASDRHRAIASHKFDECRFAGEKTTLRLLIRLRSARSCPAGSTRPCALS